MKRLLLVHLFCCAFFITQAQTTHYVLNANDTGMASLRATVDSALSGDIIRFHSSLLGDTIFLSTKITLNKDVSIVGLFSGQDSLVIDMKGQGRAFKVVGNCTVYIDSLYIKRSYPGAIFVFNSTLYLENTLISDCSSPDGAAISLRNSSLYAKHLMLRNNEVSNYGGGIYLRNSKMNLTNSTIKKCKAKSGAAIFLAFGSEAEVAYTTINANVATNRGGGIFMEQNSNFSLTTSTVANNKAGFCAGIESVNSKLRIMHSTIVGNMPNLNGCGGIRFGGGDTLWLGHTILADNDLYELVLYNNGKLMTLGYNIIEQPGMNITLDSTDMLSSYLPLGVLADNGGFTKTVLPSFGSLAIDAGDSGVTAMAQNGILPVGRRDIGAAETNYIEGCMDATACNYNIEANIASECYYASDSIVHVESCDAYLWNGLWYINSGVFVDTLTNKYNCDSVVFLNLTIEQSKDTTLLFHTCVGDTVTVGSSSYHLPGYYADFLSTSKDCDSVVYTQIIFDSSYTYYQTIQLCEGDTFCIGGHCYIAPACYEDTLANAQGCDSIVHTTLEFLPPAVVPSIYGDTYVEMNSWAMFLLMPNFGSDYEWGCSSGYLDTTFLSSQVQWITNTLDTATLWVIEENELLCAGDTAFHQIIPYISVASMEERREESALYPNPSSQEQVFLETKRLLKEVYLTSMDAKQDQLFFQKAEKGYWIKVGKRVAAEYAISFYFEEGDPWRRTILLR
jgi:parallel beta-helix repeat protein